MTLTCAFSPFATVGCARYFLSTLRRFTTCIFVLFAISTAPAQVTGSGTAGSITKWTGTKVIGNSVMTEKTGNIGIGTGTPAFKLTVTGIVQSTSGGFKFPDGSVQGTAGVLHNATLAGKGISGSTLTVAVPLVLSGSAPTGVVQGKNTGSGYGTYGTSVSGFGVYGESAGAFGVGGTSTNNIGVYANGGYAGLSAYSNTSYGVLSGSSNGRGVYAYSTNADAIYAEAGNGNTVNTVGVTGKALSTDGTGVVGEAENGTSAWGLWGISASGYAGFFSGNVFVGGTLTKSSGTFKIDHPLDPENKYLSHSFVESPDMMNIYNGNIVTDGNGEATVRLPVYFASLNRDCRYQLTVIGQFAQAIVAAKIRNNRFTIKTDKPNVEVSWQVTGIRQDPYAKAHPVIVEQPKPQNERGSYLHPELYGQNDEKGLEWALRTETMKARKEQRQRQ
jgi:hypothetical protein